MTPLSRRTSPSRTSNDAQPVRMVASAARVPHELPNTAEANTAGLPANRYRPTGRPQFGTAMVDMKHVR
jgi:hypothetical protein